MAAEAAAPGATAVSASVVAPAAPSRRLGLLLGLAAFALAALACLAASAPAETLEQRLARYPYLPAAVMPGITARQFQDAMASSRYQIDPGGIANGALVPGVVHASSPDRRIAIYLFVDGQGEVAHVRYKLTANDTVATQLSQRIDQAYAGALWQKDGSAIAQTAYTRDGARVILYQLFECDPDIREEPFYLNLDITDPSAVKRSSWWPFAGR